MIAISEIAIFWPVALIPVATSIPVGALSNLRKLSYTNDKMSRYLSNHIQNWEYK